MKATIHNTTIELVQGDITEMDTDAIVNAANERLAHGGGVAGAIVRKGGPVIQEESNAWVRAHGRVPTGGAAITSGGSLKARFVIHAVGPVMGSGNEGEKIRQATLASLRLAEEHNLASIAFPAISTGIFGCPMDL
ncbi:MAG: macro domain-containing protein, partial [candidate division KSB1 bacterium]|nr:macro domain-containing protein [candidate division KSB1 bacterium]